MPRGYMVTMTGLYAAAPCAKGLLPLTYYTYTKQTHAAPGFRDDAFFSSVTRKSFPSPPLDPVIPVDAADLEMLKDLAVVLADVLGVEAVAAALRGVPGEGGLLALERDIAAAHERLAEVVEAVAHVPGLLLGHGDVLGVVLRQAQRRVRLGYGVL